MKNKRILIVEKEGIIAMDIKTILNNKGYNVIGISADLNEIEKYLNNKNLNLVISDYTMHKSASDFTEKVIKKYKIPIIYLTGSNQAKRSKSNLMENCVVISKPFDEEDFLSNVNNMVKRDLND